jgi:hypothetical protein
MVYPKNNLGCQPEPVEGGFDKLNLTNAFLTKQPYNLNGHFKYLRTNFYHEPLDNLLPVAYRLLLLFA